MGGPNANESGSGSRRNFFREENVYGARLAGCAWERGGGMKANEMLNEGAHLAAGR